MSTESSSHYTLLEERLIIPKAIGVEPGYRAMTGLDLSYVAEPEEFYLQHPPKGVVINSWPSMLKELKEVGFSVSRVSHMTGIPSRTIRRWFNGEEKELPSPRLFSQVLCLYCRYKLNLCRVRKLKRRKSYIRKRRIKEEKS